MAERSLFRPSRARPQPIVLDLSTTEIAVGAGGLVSLVAYVWLIVIPAWTSYGRWWERIAAAFMTLFILATLVGIGAGFGAAIIWSWDRWA
ncbi:MAG: hypothetical protein QOC95_391 [Thermoleophilaceae bacterium]|jgi:hypothetical protein|nr:hypothetical protein [Thermoleophilaceae bacterium]